MHPINPKELLVFYIFQGLIHIFKDNFTKQFQDKSPFQIPGVFQDQGQIQGLFQACANPVLVQVRLSSAHQQESREKVGVQILNEKVVIK